LQRVVKLRIKAFLDMKVKVFLASCLDGDGAGIVQKKGLADAGTPGANKMPDFGSKSGRV